MKFFQLKFLILFLTIFAAIGFYRAAWAAEPFTQQQLITQLNTAAESAVKAGVFIKDNIGKCNRGAEGRVSELVAKVRQEADGHLGNISTKFAEAEAASRRQPVEENPQCPRATVSYHSDANLGYARAEIAAGNAQGWAAGNVRILRENTSLYNGSVDAGFAFSACSAVSSQLKAKWRELQTHMQAAEQKITELKDQANARKTEHARVHGEVFQAARGCSTVGGVAKR